MATTSTLRWYSLLLKGYNPLSKKNPAFNYFFAPIPACGLILGGTTHNRHTMIYYLKYDVQAICKRLIEDGLKNSGLNYSLINANELDINQSLPNDFLLTLNSNLTKLGIEIVSSQKNILVQKIKDAIIDLVNLEDKLILSKTSHHLAKTLNHSYRYLSGIFSEITYTTIENYIILQKIEKAKAIIAAGEFTFTEIAWKLNYSSVGHFSMQFKNTTGFTPTLFKRIMNQRRSNVILNAANKIDKEYTPGQQ